MCPDTRRETLFESLGRHVVPERYSGVEWLCSRTPFRTLRYMSSLRHEGRNQIPLFG